MKQIFGAALAALFIAALTGPAAHAAGFDRYGHTDHHVYGSPEDTLYQSEHSQTYSKTGKSDKADMGADTYSSMAPAAGTPSKDSSDNSAQDGKSQKDTN